jgi:hypothetical protein
LALGACIGLAAIDVIYVARGVILPIYLGDAAIEVVLVILWIICLPDVKRSQAITRRE